MNNVQAHLMPVPLQGGSRLGIEHMNVDDANDEVDEDIDDDKSNSSSSSSSSESSDEGSSGDSSTVSTTEGDETPQNSALELAQITKEVIQLPRDLCEYEQIFREFFTEDLWSELSNEQRVLLQSKLPDFSSLLEPNEASAEQRHTVHLLFQDKLQRFGRTPLGELYRNLEAGHYRPDVKVLRESIAKSKRREQRFRECERLGILAKRLFIAREQLLRSAYSCSPDESTRLDRTLSKQQQHHSFLFNADTKISAVRARKRFYLEMSEIKKQAGLSPSEVLSADEEDKDEEDSLAHMTPEWLAEELNALKSVASLTSSTDKCIYDTFFKQRPTFTDEESMRLSQYAKRPKLTNRNYREYLLDYKRKRLIEPDLPDYETADIRLRDVCARAQITGNFKRSFPMGQKPGRKGKLKLNEPPALVPITYDSSAVSQMLEQPQDNQSNTIGLLQQRHILSSAPSSQMNTLQYTDNILTQNDAFNVYDGEVEVQQEEVETYTEEIESTNYTVNNEVVTTAPSPAKPFNTKAIIRALPKLEPISQRSINVPLKDKLKSPLKTTIIPMNSIHTSKKFIPAMDSTPYASTPHANTSNDLIQDTHACFFALIRDLFCGTPNHRMKFDELKQRIQIWLSNPITALNDWYAKSNNWAGLLTLAIKFLAGDFAEQPEDYVPYVEFKAQLNIYQWIGAGRDSDARLTTLCDYWMDHRKDMHSHKSAQQQQAQQMRLNIVRGSPQIFNVETNHNETIQTNLLQSNNNSISSVTTPLSTNASNFINLMSMTPPPPPRCPTMWTVRAATADEILEFQRQERERFDNPHRAYTYRMNGYESIVGPVRGIYSQTLALTKARGHSMMVDDRPNFVTILTLVRDATARLPNGEGTRTDISELLKCSQYINPDSAENVMQTIVSGALDRLHTEADPCVRYDPKRKIWIYLHRNRSEADFERMHQQQQGQSKPTKQVKTLTAPTTAFDTTTRKVIQKAVIKTVPAREGTITNANASQILNQMTLPALVPSNPILITTQATSAATLPRHNIPVPPLKYNIPTSVTVMQQQQQQQQQLHQKSLLKTTINTQRRVIDPKTGATMLTTGMTTLPIKTIQTSKQLGFTLPQGSKLVNASNSPSTTAKTPFIVTNASGVQTLHVQQNALHLGNVVAASGATANPATASLTATTVAGKRVALSKPIIINQISSKTQSQNQQQQQQQLQSRTNATQIITTTAKQQQQLQKQQSTQGYIIPLNSPNANMQIQLPPQLLHSNVSAISPTRSTNSTINTPQNKSGVHTIVVDPNSTAFATVNTDASKSTPKNIIRFVPNAKSQQQQQQLQQQQVVGNKLIGQRIVSTTGLSNNSNNITMRGTTKILSNVINTNSALSPMSANNQAAATTTLLQSNNATMLSPSSVNGGASGGVPGTIIKMSPQAFNALQQKQQQQQQLKHIVKTSGANVTLTTTPQRQQQQQRLIIGNTAIIGHNTTSNNNVGKSSKQQSPNTTLQATTKVLPSSTIITNTKTAVDATTSTTSTPLNSTNKVQMVNATNLTPQQQRVLIQNFKQQQQQHQQNIITKPLAVVVSQTPTGLTRVIKTTSPNMGATTPTSTTATTNATKILNTSTGGATGQIITLDSFLQQQQLNSAVDGNSGTIITPISTAQFNNIITLGGTAQQRLITTQAKKNNTSNFITDATTTTAAGGGGGGGGNGGLRVIQTSNNVQGGSGITNAGNTGATTFSIANIQGKQVVFATKAPMMNAKQVTNLGQVIQTSGTGGNSNVTSGSVILGGQTLKLQGNQLQNLGKASGGTITTVSGANIASSASTVPTSQMQTVIMGNQILRVLPQGLVTTTNKTSNKNDGASATQQHRLVAIGNNSGKIVSGGTTSVGTSTSLPKTLVLGSGTQTIRVQTSNASSTASSQQQETTSQANAQKATPVGNRVVLAVQGGGQILLPSNFTAGGSLNLKSLQNMKLVSLTQVPQQLQDKSKANIGNTTNSPKTTVKSIVDNSS